MIEALSLAGRRHACSVIRSERSGANSDRRRYTSPQTQFQLVTRIAWQPSRAPARTKLKLSSGALVFRRQLSSRIVQPSRQPSSQLRRPAVTAASSTSRTNVVAVLLIFPFFSHFQWSLTPTQLVMVPSPFPSQRPNSSWTIAGRLSISASSTRAGPSGRRRPCSQFLSVPSGMSMLLAKAGCDSPVLGSAPSSGGNSVVLFLSSPPVTQSLPESPGSCSTESAW